MTAGVDLVEVPEAPPGERQPHQSYQPQPAYREPQPMYREPSFQEQAVREASFVSFPEAPPPMLSGPGHVVVTEQTPVFSGPVYNLNSLDNLPDPVESEQTLEKIEGDDSNPFAPQRYRLVTTHILPPVVVYAPQPPPHRPPGDPPIVRRRRERKPWLEPLGQLILDPLAADGIAVKLLLLEARAPFVVNEVDPFRDTNVTVGNPHGKVPCWIDLDGSCVWESHAIMRYINDKHGLEDQFYFADQGPLKWRTDMALDWCQEFLMPHVHQVLNPETHEHQDLSDLPGGQPALDRDYKALTDYFLRETAFVGGAEPNMADYSICMQLLLLYATRHPPPDRVRQYLHNTAEHVENWNDVTLPIREFCMLRQKELRETDANMERLLLEEDRMRRRDLIAQQEREDAIRRLREMEEERNQWEEDERRREAEDQRRRQEQDQQMKEEWEAKRRALEERREKNDADRYAAQAELQRLKDEQRRREEEQREWAEEYERRMQQCGLRKGSSASVRPQIGVEIKMLDDSQGKKDCIVCVERVVPGGPAEMAGIQAEDVIDRWNGERIYSKTQWADKVKKSRIGSQVTLTVYRGSDPQEVTVTIAGTGKSLGAVRKVHSKTQVSHNIRYEKTPSYTAVSSPESAKARRKSGSPLDLSRELSIASVASSHGHSANKKNARSFSMESVEML